MRQTGSLRTGRRRRLVVRRPVLQHGRVAAPAHQRRADRGTAPARDRAPDGVTVVAVGSFSLKPMDRTNASKSHSATTGGSSLTSNLMEIHQ